ncbi:hypothetical protein N0V88_003313 [Collariella sp. IMI 366227]|nr:hypothetical protein N0V88_003313 [Collariella sp. IMI 366227]
MAVPTEIKAVVITRPGTAEVKTVPLPTLPDDYILVRTTAVALNPTDWKHVQGVGQNTGSIVGCDYAGVVEQVGSKVTKAFAKGDRVAGMVHGSNQSRPEGGAFGEYIIAKGDLQIKTPDNLSDVEAATLGVGISTVGQGLYQTLSLPPPNAPSKVIPPPEILIYGGSSATGLLGIQFAALSGYRVATTCSPSNFDYVRSLGASAAFDYRSPTIAADIQAWSADPDNLTLAWDCIGTEDSAKICANALSRTKEGKYRTLLRVDEKVVTGANEKVSCGMTLAYTMFGEMFDKGKAVPAIPSHFEFGKGWWEVARGCWSAGR